MDELILNCIKDYFEYEEISFDDEFDYKKLELAKKISIEVKGYISNKLNIVDNDIF